MTGPSLGVRRLAAAFEGLQQAAALHDYSLDRLSQSSRNASPGERPLRRGFSRIVDQRSATPHARNVVAKTVKNSDIVFRRRRKNSATGTITPMITAPMTSLTPDTPRHSITCVIALHQPAQSDQPPGSPADRCI